MNRLSNFAMLFFLLRNHQNICIFTRLISITTLLWSKISASNDHQGTQWSYTTAKKDGSGRKKSFVHKLAFIFIFAISACCHSRAHSDDFSTYNFADAHHQPTARQTSLFLSIQNMLININHYGVVDSYLWEPFFVSFYFMKY